MANAKMMRRITPVCRSPPTMRADFVAGGSLLMVCIIAAPVPPSIPTTHTAPSEATWVQAARGFSSTWRAATRSVASLARCRRCWKYIASSFGPMMLASSTTAARMTAINTYTPTMPVW